MQADKTIFNAGAELLDIKFNTKEGENMKRTKRTIKLNDRVRPTWDPDKAALAVNGGIVVKSMVSGVLVKLDAYDVPSFYARRDLFLISKGE